MSEEEKTALLIQMKFEGKVILWGDGIHDDTEGFDLWRTFEPVYSPQGVELSQLPLKNLKFWVPGYEGELDLFNSKPDHFDPDDPYFTHNCEFSKEPISPWNHE